MGNYTLEMILYWLTGRIVRVRRSASWVMPTGGIEFITEEEGTLTAGCLYIGTIVSVSAAIAAGRIPPEGVCILCPRRKEGEPFLQDNCLPPQLSLVETGMDLLALYNLIHYHIHTFHAWQKRLQDLIHSGHLLPELMKCICEELSGTLLLVNAGYKCMAAVYDPSTPAFMTDELRETGYLSFETVRNFYRNNRPVRETEDQTREYHFDESGSFLIAQKIHFQNRTVAHLIVIQNISSPHAYCSDLSRIAADLLGEYLFASLGVDYVRNEEFGALVSDLIEQRLTGREEIQDRLKYTRLAVIRYYHLMLVRFSEKDRDVSVPWNYIISQLQILFPMSNITMYRGDILMLVRKTKRMSRLPINNKALRELLDSYNGYACAGNASEFLSSLPVLYYQTRDALRLGIAMDPDTRIYYYEDYSIYEIIELASEAAKQHLGSANLVHLCNNELVALIQYDRKNGTDLVKILHTYLLHERSKSETAKALFLHRNTLIYKIQKIEEVMDCSLDNPKLRERLLLGCRILEYIETYRKDDIMKLKPVRPKVNILDEKDPASDVSKDNRLAES